jgi:hypothetical protein
VLKIVELWMCCEYIVVEHSRDSDAVLLEYWLCGLDKRDLLGGDGGGHVLVL